jgi:shikimate kinase
VTKILSEKLDMFLLDLKELIAFELADRENIIEKCGLDYFLNLEKKTIQSAASFENTIIVSNYDLFTYRQNYVFFKPVSISFYLRFSKNNLKEENEVDSLNIMAFEARDKSLKENCNFTINLTNTNEEKAALKIIAKLKEVVNGSKF